MVSKPPESEPQINAMISVMPTTNSPVVILGLLLKVRELDNQEAAGVVLHLLAGLAPRGSTAHAAPSLGTTKIFPHRFRAVPLTSMVKGTAFFVHLSPPVPAPIPDSEHDLTTIGPLEGMGVGSPTAAFA